MTPHPPLLLSGKVVSTLDPASLGRVQVDATLAGTTLHLPWIRVLQPLADPDGGSFVLPEKGSAVMVLCGAGSEPDGMLVLGAVYDSGGKPKTPDTTGTNDIKQILTRGGNQITLTDTAGAERISVKTKEGTISLTFDAVQKSVTLEAQGDVVLTSTTGNLRLAAANTLTLQGKDIKINADNELLLTANANTTLKGAETTIEGMQRASLVAGGVVEVTAAGITLEGTLVEVK